MHECKDICEDMYSCHIGSSDPSDQLLTIRGKYLSTQKLSSLGTQRITPSASVHRLCETHRCRASFLVGDARQQVIQPTLRDQGDRYSSLFIETKTARKF